jgi:O-antigen/teichoic acid export membrane protein
VFIFLLVTLFIDFFKYFVGDEFRAGLEVVPILLLANLCLGIYVNLSIWYKLTDRTLMGAMVSLAGATLTVVLNIWWIPLLGYVGSAWATLACYSSMAIVSYLLGQKYYPVDYDVKRVIGYIGLGIGLYYAHGQLLMSLTMQPWLLASALMLLYVLITALCESRRLVTALA